MISVVCVYNDLRIYNEYLLPSIQRQHGNHEFIALDNQDGYFSSAAQALNHGGRKATGAYIMFVHQDVRLNSGDWLDRAEEMLRLTPNLGIAGVAGKRDRSGVITALTHGDRPKLAGHLQPTKPLRVQTIDECLFFVPREVFVAINMDESTCENWHLYAVDYSLSIQERGLTAYVLPLQAYHESEGQLSEAYFVALRKIVAKHKGHYSTIYTTVWDWSTAIPIRMQRAYCQLIRRIRKLMASMRAR